MRNFLRRFYPTLLVAGAILYLSLGHVSAPPDNKIPYFDKVAHLCMYGGLTLILCFDLLRHRAPRSTAQLWWRGFLPPVLYSASMEVAQVLLTTYRSGDWYDLLFNTLGALLALLFSCYVTTPLLLWWGAKKGRTQQR